MAKSTHTLCAECFQNTNHSILFSKRVTNNLGDEDEVICLHEDFMVVQCRGCDNVSFLKRDSGDVYTDIDGNPDFADNNFPVIRSTSQYVLLDEEEIEMLPSTIYELYDQVSIAFENDANMLAGVGLRMLIESNLQ